ncbi:Uncharacterised protein [Shigella flexneri]|nr:Uncharacterised protein [Shigella flexneri]
MSGGRHFKFTVGVALQHAALEIKTSWRFFQAGRCAYALARGQAAGGVAA